MKLSSQEEYGLRLLLRLAREQKESLTISELSQLEGLTVPNVAKMMRVLRRGGFVTSTRGKDGGYVLSRCPSEINVGEALALLGGRLYDARFCDTHSGSALPCARVSGCSIRSVWARLQQAIDGVLGALSLDDLLRGEGSPASPASPRAVALPQHR